MIEVMTSKHRFYCGLNWWSDVLRCGIGRVCESVYNYAESVVLSNWKLMRQGSEMVFAI